MKEQLKEDVRKYELTENDKEADEATAELIEAEE